MANVKVELTGDEQRLLRSLDKIVQKERELAARQAQTDKESQRGADNVEKGMRKLGQARNEALGDNAIRQLKDFAVGFAGVSGAIALGKQMLADFRKEREEALKSLQATTPGTRRLAQLAERPEDLQRMMAAVKSTRLETGMGAEQAAGLQFLLESQGLADQRKLFAQVSEFAGAEAVATGTGKMLAGFGSKEAGTARQVVNKLLMAAKTSDIDVEKLAPAAAIFATPAAGVGGSDEEALAALSVLSPVFKSPETAAERLKSLYMKIGEKGLGGKGLLGGMEGMQAQLMWATAGLTGKEEIAAARSKFFGSQEAQTAYEAVMGKQLEIQSLSSELAVEGYLPERSDAVSRRMAVLRGTPAYMATRDLQLAKTRAELSREGAYGIQEAGVQAAQERLAVVREGEGFAERFARKSMGYAASWLPGNEGEDVEAAGQVAGTVTRLGVDAVGFMLRNNPHVVAARAMLSAGEMLRDGVRQMKSSPTLSKPDRDK